MYITHRLLLYLSLGFLGLEFRGFGGGGMVQGSEFLVLSFPDKRHNVDDMGPSPEIVHGALITHGFQDKLTGRSE